MYVCGDLKQQSSQTGERAKERADNKQQTVSKFNILFIVCTMWIDLWKISIGFAKEKKKTKATATQYEGKNEIQLARHSMHLTKVLAVS